MSDLLAHGRGVVRIDVTIADDAAVHGRDADQLELAILNLGINARDAMAEGGTLTIEAEEVAEPERPTVDRLLSSDTGTGIPPEVWARAMEPFSTTKEVGQGTGLGLSQVYGLAQESGSTSIRSTRSGTTVDDAACWSAACRAAGGNGRRATKPSGTRSRQTRLLVDDDAKRTAVHVGIPPQSPVVAETENGARAATLKHDRSTF